MALTQVPGSMMTSPVTLTGNLTVGGSGGITFSDSSAQTAAASPYVLKNRIINGAMVIDQRNNGASASFGTGGYTLDRWICYSSVSSKYTVQQNAGSVTPPTGFTKYLGCTSSSAYTVGSSDYFAVTQNIEGINVADLAFGTANAATITVSFWVYSSLTGTFGASIFNGATANRFYPFTYTISSANTWTKITKTIPGDTTGTWVKDTSSSGMAVYFGLGLGSTYQGTANTWSSMGYVPSGCVNVVSTNGATWYVTGVQLEIGSTATPFEQRLYNQELANCQRYFQIFGGAFNGSVAYVPYCNGVWGNTTQASMVLNTNQVMRATPTVTYSSAGSFQCRASGSSPACTNIYSDIACPTGIMFVAVIASGATAGYAAQLFQTASTLSSISFSAEL